MEKIKIGFVGTDGRSFLSALETGRSKSELYDGEFEGFILRGTSAMLPLAEIMNWPVGLIQVKENSASAFAEVLINAFEKNELDLAMVLPETLIFNGLVDEIITAGHGDKIIGLDKSGAFIEADKIACKNLCRDAGIPVADKWEEVDASDFNKVLEICLDYLHEFGGVVLKYPFSAGGKGARIILNTWEIKATYDQLIADYKNAYTDQFGRKNYWPLLIEARMSGVEISFTILVDKNGNYQILPTAMDYPERFAGPPGIHNPITGGMGAISPHPLESAELIEMAKEKIAEPLIKIMKEKGILRQCVLYPGCFVSFYKDFKPRDIRVCEINIRLGEPEFQPVVKRLRNLGPLIKAMADGNLDNVTPEIRGDQISICVVLVTGPGGPQGQKGYPWSYTKDEEVIIDFEYLKKKNITLIPSAMSYDVENNKFRSDGSRVCYLLANAKIKPGQKISDVAEILRQKLFSAFDNCKVRAIPREDTNGNRLDLRRDIGLQYEIYG